ncbi:TIGR04222 domain-containing membrane protein [Streptomyces sp. HUAS TT20]|uniref:TIGR04222 domain-containing membrane protein n=1 Tax=Streptomyces sp. HUAS TT20 TaxID=3447509 RepID=UPI00295458E4|nr:TIGR04222 domain-containing membrane protein [Streptomyces sp. HUAS 15-9]
MPGTRSLSARWRPAPARGWVMSSTPTGRLEPYEIALVRGGPRAAVTVAVLDLHLRGAVGAGRAGTMRTSGPVGGSELPPLTRAVHAALYRSAGMRQLLDRQGVRSALAEARGNLTTAGLLRSFPPGRPRAARRALKDLREQHPLPAVRTGLSARDTLLAVALYGDRALTALAPRFAQEAGLTGRGGTTDHEVPRSSSGGGGFTCGSV